MRTTIDISDLLYRRAKVTAAVQGITLKELISSILENYFNNKTEGSIDNKVDLPIIKGKADLSHLDNKTIDELLTDEELKNTT